MITDLPIIRSLLSVVGQTQVDYAERVRGLRSAFQPIEAEPPDVQKILNFCMIGLAALAALLISRGIWQRRSGKNAARNPMWLFSHVLKQLGIGYSDRFLLKSAARSTSLKQPTLMLFSPALLERYAGLWADSIPVRPVRERVRTRLIAIAEKAFPPEDEAEMEDTGA